MADRSWAHVILTMLAIVGVAVLLGLGSASATSPAALLQLSGSPFADAHGAEAVAFSPDDAHLAVANSDGTVSVFAVNTHTEALTAISGSPFSAGTTGTAYSADYSPNGAFLAVGTDNGVFEFSVNPTTGALSELPGSPYTLPGSVPSVQFSPNSGMLAASDSSGNGVAVFIVNEVTGALTSVSGSPFSTGASSFPYGVAFSPSGRFLAVAGSDSNDVLVFSVNAATGALTQVAGATLASGALPFGLTFSPNGRFLAVGDSGTSDAPVYSFNTSTGALTNVPGSPFPTGPNPYSVAFSPNGQLLASANEGGGAGDLSVFAVNASSGALNQVTGSPYTTGQAPESVAFGPGGGLLAVANVRSGSFSVYGLPAPTPTISSPAPGTNPTYAVGAAVTSSFSCADAQYGPGVASCADSNGQAAPDGQLATSTPGQYTYTVTALSSDGESASAQSTYTVAAAPIVSVTTPVSEHSYSLDATVPASFGCSDGVNGPGIAPGGCSGTVADGAAIDTATLGSHSFTVTATSRDGQSTSRTVTYSVTATPVPPGPGPAPGTPVPGLGAVSTSHTQATVAVTCTGPPGQRCVGAVVGEAEVGASKKVGAAAATVTVARAPFSVLAGGRTSLRLAPNALGRRLLADHYRLPVRITIAGSTLHRSATFSYLRFPALNISYSFSEPANTSYTLVDGLVVTQLPPATSVVLTCSGGGCPFSRRAITPRRTSVVLKGLVSGDRFLPGARLALTQIAPSYVGKVLVMVMRGRGQGPRIQKLCLPPGLRRPAACA